MSNVATSTVSLAPDTFGEITTRTVAPKSTPVVKPAAKRVRKPATPKVVAEQPKVAAKVKAADQPVKEDYKYLAAKEPTDLHVEMAKWMTEVTGIEVTAKQAQVVSVLRHEYQRSEANQAILKTKRDAAAKRKAEEAKARTARERKEFERLQAKFAADTAAAKAAK